MYKKYESVSDEELIAALRGGDQEVMDYLMEKYKYLVRRHANKMFLLGGDTDDVIQEGMIGLFRAVRDFDPSRETSFFSFADLCISRQIYTAVEAASRKKHGPLNSYISLNDTGNEGEDRQDLLALRSDSRTEPEAFVIGEETARVLLTEIRDNLSRMENEVLDLYLEGLNYHQIAEKMRKKDKAIDNALQRIRRKISHITGETEE